MAGVDDQVLEQNSLSPAITVTKPVDDIQIAVQFCSGNNQGGPSHCFEPAS